VGCTSWRASKAFSPVARMMPTALSVQSDALIARVHGLACRLARTCSRFLLVLVTAGPHSGPVAAAASTAVRAEPSGQHRQGRLPAAGGDAGRVVFDGVVKQRGARANAGRLPATSRISAGPRLKSGRPAEPTCRPRAVPSPLMSADRYHVVPVNPTLRWISRSDAEPS
jgi:hypothetical protein